MRKGILANVAAVLITAVLLVMGLAPLASADMPTLETVTFPVDSFVVPMDGKQAALTAIDTTVYGFIWKVLNDGGIIFRIIEPPDVTLKTGANPGGALYSGGVILILPGDAAIVAAAQAAFPTVTVHTLTEEFTSDNVFRVENPTLILVIDGIWGDTDVDLDAMGVPYDIVQTSDVEADPLMLFNYNVVVVDCPGWDTGFGGVMPDDVRDSLRAFAWAGGELIFTDRAISDQDYVFPGYVSVVTNIDGVWDATIHNPPITGFSAEYPTQYPADFPIGVKIYTMGAGKIVNSVTQPAEVRVWMDCANYDSGVYRVLGFYFQYGTGIVEGMAYHPQEQTEFYTGDPNSFVAGTVFFGNKMVFAQAPPPPPPTVLDHFTCYFAEDVTGLPIGEVVYLEDQFVAVNATVEWAMAFANPAEKCHGDNVTPISNPDHHFTAYTITYEEEPQTWRVEVDNQFGSQNLTVWGPVGLGVPTQKEGHEPPVGLDHFLLYEVIEGPPVEVMVCLNDEFGAEPEVYVYEPVLFANPVQKTHDGNVTEIVNPGAHAVIYSIAGEYFEREVQVVNQFGEQTLDVYGPYMLAVPSEKIISVPLTDVAITKWGWWQGILSPGSTMNYGIGYINQGGTPAQDVTIVDQLPPEVDYVSSTGGTYNPATHTVSWNLGTLNPWQYGTLVITVWVHWGLANGTQLVDIVNISTSSSDSDPTNNQSSWIATIGAASDPNDKAVSPEGYVRAGQTLDYTVRYENVGAGIAFGVYVTDVLDEDLDDSTLVIGGGGTYDIPTRTITWLIGEVGPGEGGTLTFSANVRSDATHGSVVTNYATVHFPSVPEVTPTNIVVNTVDTAPPTITGKSPIGSAVPIDSSITIAFSESMDTSSAQSAFSISPTVPGSFSWTGNTTTFDPTTNLAYSTEYTVTIRGTARDSVGNGLDGNGNGIAQGSPADDYTWSFTTKAAGGGCFIATAAYGTPMAEEIQILREFRDEYLLTNPVGKGLVDLYYRVSPPMAEFITEHPSLKPIVRAGLVPAVAMSTIAVNTTPAEKMVIVGLLALVSVALAVWATRRRSRGPEYS